MERGDLFLGGGDRLRYLDGHQLLGHAPGPAAPNAAGLIADHAPNDRHLRRILLPEKRRIRLDNVKQLGNSLSGGTTLAFFKKALRAKIG